MKQALKHWIFLLPLTALLLSACGSVPKTTGNGSARLPGMPTSGPILQCHSELQDAAVQFTPLPDRYMQGGCSQIGVVRLASLDLSRVNSGAGRMDISNLGPVTCPMAQRFSGWAQYGVARAARQILGSELVRIETFGSYSCRNIAGSRRLSQHAHANAIDVSGFVLADGRRISVKDDWDGGSRKEREFLRTIHQSACKRFGTVLGPEFNAAHRDHFHLDMADNGGYCR